MKKNKKLMFVPLILGSLIGASGCSLTDVNINKDSMNQIMNSVEEYMGKNNAYSSTYTKDSLMSLLNKGFFELTSNPRGNFEMTEIMYSYDDYGNPISSSEPHCIYDDIESYDECFQPYLNIKVYYDESTGTFKYYEKSGGYNTANNETSWSKEDYIFIKKVENSNMYRKTHYKNDHTFTTVEKRNYELFSENEKWSIYFKQPSRVVHYYNIIYKEANAESSFISFNKIDDTTVEYVINNYETNNLFKCTFVNGMLEKFQTTNFNVWNGSGDDRGGIEINIKYNSSDITVANIDSYTEVTE